MFSPASSVIFIGGSIVAYSCINCAIFVFSSSGITDGKVCLERFSITCVFASENTFRKPLLVSYGCGFSFVSPLFLCARSLDSISLSTILFLLFKSVFLFLVTECNFFRCIGIHFEVVLGPSSGVLIVFSGYLFGLFIYVVTLHILKIFVFSRPQSFAFIDGNDYPEW